MLSSLEFVDYAITAVVVACYGYIAYSALAIRRTLGADLYRRQALGMCAIAIVFVALFLAWVSYYGFGLVSIPTSLILLYWVDTFTLAARRSDPLVRDTLKWSRLRYLCWGISIFANIFIVGVFFSYSLGFTVTGGILFYVIDFIFDLPIYLAAIVGVAVMPIAARRTKDATLRSQLLWFFIFLAIQLFLQGGVGLIYGSTGVAVYSDNIGLIILVSGISMLAGIYPLYKSVKKLVPVYKFPDEKTQLAGNE